MLNRTCILWLLGLLIELLVLEHPHAPDLFPQGEALYVTRYLEFRASQEVLLMLNRNLGVRFVYNEHNKF